MKYLRLLSLIMVFVLVSACGGAPEPAPQVEPVNQQPATEAPAVVAPPVVTEAPVVAEAPVATTTTGCSDSAQLASENPPDGNRVKAGDSFEKVWNLLNTGTCTWDSTYRLLFAEGAQLAGLKEVQPLVNNSIPPGSSLSIFITMRAPTTAGEFTAKWQWFDGNGNFVPVQINNTQVASYITVRIIVP